MAEKIMARMVITCDRCNCDNVFSNRSSYIVSCWNCGKNMMLCEACLSAEDNTSHFCDYKERKGKCSCFRGWFKADKNK